MTQKKKYSSPEISYWGQRSVQSVPLDASAIWDEQTEQLIRSKAVNLQSSGVQQQPADSSSVGYYPGGDQAHAKSR